MNKLHSLILAITLLVGSVSVATAQDFDKGLKAAQAGDLQTALQEWRLSAEAGFAPAQANLALMYHNGQGVPQDYAEAAKLYRLAAEQGIAGAQTNLGSMYYRGEGVLQDSVVAHMWFNIGAANGNELGGTNRDSISEGMTQQAIEQAQQMARDCMSSNYQNCGE